MTFFRVLAVIALLAIAVGIGIGVYNAGVQQGVAEAGRAAQAAGENPAIVYPPYVGGPYHWGWGGGFGFFGFIFWILGFFLILARVRAAFGWGRWGGRGHGNGPGGGWSGGREERIAEYHRELHRRDEGAEASSG